MGAGAEGEVRPFAWKRGLKLKWKLRNEAGGLRSSSQQREREREREREEHGGEEAPRPQGEWCPEVNLFFFSLVYIAVWRVGSAELQREHWQSDVLVQQGAGENAPTGTIAAVVVDRGMDRGRKTLVAPLVSFEKNEHNLNFEVYF
jgi:hypothetical protein